MVKLECDIAAQNCASLFSRTTSLIKLPYGAGSCVRDARLPGTVGRCGFPGAACVTDAQGNDNCAYGGDSTKPNYKPLCQKGICGGGVGAICTNGDFDCNWGYYCNATAPNLGVCGGQGSFVSDQGDGGDFAADYCLSGKASLASNGFWYCIGGQFVASIPSSSSSSSSAPVSSTSNPVVVPISSANGLSSASLNPPISSSSSSNGAQSTDALAISAPGSPPFSGSSSSTGSNTAGNSQATDLSSNTNNNNSSSDKVAGTHTSSNSKTPIIAGVCAAVGIVLVALLAFLTWRHFRKQQKAKLALRENISYPVPTQPTGFSNTSQQPPPSFTTTSGPASIPAATSSFAYLPEIQGDGAAAMNNTGSTYPAGYHPVAPSSPHYNFPAAASNPSLVPQDPFMNPPAEIAYQGTGQYPSGGNLDATERHLLAVREEAERHLREYNQRGR